MSKQDQTNNPNRPNPSTDPNKNPQDPSKNPNKPYGSKNNQAR